MPQGTLIGEVIHKGRRIRWTAGAGMRPYPMAVVVGLRTRSAAEILADALKDRRHTVVVGQRTSGAVLGSEIVPLGDGGRLKLATMDLVRPGNRRLEGMGVVPDVESGPRYSAGEFDPQIADAEIALGSLG